MLAGCGFPMLLTARDVAVGGRVFGADRQDVVLGDSAPVMSHENGVCPPSCQATTMPFTQTVAR